MRRRGFSLIELMVVVAISAVLIAAAVATFTAMLNQRRKAERTLDIYSAMRMGWGVVNFDAANAGYRFPAAAFAVRVVNNVDVATSLNLNGLSPAGGVITTVANCGPTAGWGLLPGSDVLELAEGYLPEASGIVQGNTGQANVVLSGSTAPFTTVSGGARPIALFSNAAGDACMAAVSAASWPLPSSSLNLTMLKPDFSVDPGAGARYPNCPAADMHIYRLGKRTRYMVCFDTGNPAQRPILYRQVANDADGSGDLSVNGFEQVQTGIADLQIGVRINDLGMGITAGNNPACAPTATTQYCYCNAPRVGLVGGAAPCGGSDLNSEAPTFTLPNVVDSKSHLQWVRGLIVGLTAMSPQLVATPETMKSPTYRRPALLDHAAAVGDGDGNLYLAGQQSVVLLNMTMVDP